MKAFYITLSVLALILVVFGIVCGMLAANTESINDLPGNDDCVLVDYIEFNTWTDDVDRSGVYCKVDVK